MGLLFTNFVVRLGNPFKVTLARFTRRGLAWSCFATTDSAEPVLSVAFAAIFPTDLRTDLLTELAEITDLFAFDLMRSLSATIVPGGRACK